MLLAMDYPRASVSPTQYRGIAGSGDEIGSYRSELGGVAVSGDKTLGTRLWPRQREAKIHTVNCLIQVNCEVYWEIINTTNVILDISNHYDKY